MSKRTIISIDEEKCNGCGLCIPNCPEGAMRVIDGKARLISDLFCDGLGACVGCCPEGAITLTEREAEASDETRAMANLAPHGPRTTAAAPAKGPALRSTLSNWPIQMHLLSPMAPRFTCADLLLSADCVAHAVGSFHSSMLDGKALAIACPKLDEGMDIYREKLTALIDHAQIMSLTVVMMQVPCCRGLLEVARQAREQAHRPVPLKAVIVSIDDGSVLSEQIV